MLGDPGVVATLNTLNQAEVSLHEVGHAWEKVFECLKYKRLRKWVDSDVVGGSRVRRRYLEKRIIRLGGSIDVALSPATVDPKASVAEILTAAFTAAVDLWRLYQSSYEAVYAAKDWPTADDLVGLQKGVESLIFDLEAFQRQIADVGVQLWLADQV